MDRQEAFDLLVEVVCDVMGVDAADVTEATTFDDLKADSLDKLQLVMGLEERFGVTLPDDQAAGIGSVAQALDAIAAAKA